MSILTDNEINRVINKDLVIHPFDERCLTPLGYDLRVGYAINLINQPINLTDSKIVIPPKTSIFIISKENIWLSGDLIGTLHAKGSLAAAGLFINSTTVDPNWSGQMTFLVHNLNDSEIELEIESTFVTLIFHRAKISTSNRPKTNPNKVANLYGETYGSLFSNKLLGYLTSSDNTSINNEFAYMVQTGQKPSLTSQIRGLAQRGASASKSNFVRILVNVTKIFALLLAVAMVGFAVYLLFYPDIVTQLKTKYGDNIFLVVIIMAGLSIIVKDWSFKSK